MRFGKVDVRYLGGVTLLASILLVTFSAVTRRGTDWWAAWGQWIGGIGSIAAAVAALWIAHRGWVLATTEARERDAAKFAMWVTSDGSLIPVVMLVNTTALPVYDVVTQTRVSTMSFTFRLGTVSPTLRTGDEIRRLGERLALPIRSNIFERIGQDGYYETNEGGATTVSRAAKSETLDVIRQIELSVTFRQGKHRWRADHDGTLTQL
ncbi:hypothetical protein [Amycolatopsis sp. cmx-8-4]|uniref:hypothetical protein n=1 Tax=Amycolatopsis sp. cmx-8-4 TaxID=2790947 RepID=UPI00397AB394